ncbi:MAG TPA: 16S rRNA (uracil(1498)-N(3))-methyltransferase [Proteiniclasticum sp.]|jgi:16S rRNA (uracil1498-N3)-methyltransferase|uniref:16S rRNA (uracil(1498)-N(3))-methyltransferase n=1 Tax=Proteiniclasticum sp. TaxID=2053595 RepID=UPI000E89F0B1|nr:16S rRNA (uracil(1498)-N(3))-methyltransferase [Proteiniclasticum sp.]HBW12831.1 16S rRNA (uracil(1498)-N(3))-methyltransferase [Proteiniclasticum sp.]
MHKFFTDELDDVFAYIRGDDHKHLSRVLRLKEQDEILINDLKGQDYLGRIETIDKNETKVELREKVPESNESSLKVTLFQGLPKAGKMDLIVQKCTELGVQRIVPVVTERVVVKNSSEFKKLDRLKRICLEAAKQSKRSVLPEITEPMSFAELLMEMKKLDVFVVPYENQEEYGFLTLKKELANISSMGIFVGPEGGFTEKEIDLLKDKGAKILTLGNRILRTETAGFTAVAIAQLLYGDMGGK